VLRALAHRASGYLVDVVRPWCHLGKRRFERALDSLPSRDDVTVVYRSFEADPGVPPCVTRPTLEMLVSKYRMNPIQAERAHLHTEQRAADDGLMFRCARRCGVPGPAS